MQITGNSNMDNVNQIYLHDASTLYRLKTWFSTVSIFVWLTNLSVKQKNAVKQIATRDVCIYKGHWKCEVAFSSLSSISQSACSISDFMMSSQSYFDLEGYISIYEDHWEFPTNKMITPMLTWPIGLNINKTSLRNEHTQNVIWFWAVDF